MKNILRMVACVCLVAVLMLFMTGCVFDKKKAEETATAFLDTYLSGDIEKAAQFVDGGEAKELPYVNFEERDTKEAARLQKKFETDFGCSLEDYEAELLDLTQAITAARTERVSYTIENTEKVEGDVKAYKVSVKWTSIDTEKGDEDTQKKVSEEFGKALDELEKSGEFNESDSVEEQVKVFFPEMLRVMKEVHIEASKNAEVVEKKLSLTVTKIEDGWLITDGNADEFDENHVLRVLLD